MSIQSAIAAVLPSLTPSVRLVADAVMNDPGIVVSNTISDLAAKIPTSEASIVRFCRAIGLSGYKELKVGLATELGREHAQFGKSLEVGTDRAELAPLEDLAERVASRAALAVRETLEGLDLRTLSRAVDALCEADRILLFGIGISHFVAQDLQYKLFSLGCNAFALSDIREAQVALARPVPKTIALGFSRLGSTDDTVAFMRAAREGGVLAIGVTSTRRSPVAELSDVALYAQARDMAEPAETTVSRFAHLAISDCIFLAVAQRLRATDA